jgi:hypothetical protein
VSAELVVIFAALVVAVLGLAALALLVLVVADLITGWTPRHRAEDASPGVQYWARSTDADTVAIPVAGIEGRVA